VSGSIVVVCFCECACVQSVFVWLSGLVGAFSAYG